MNYIFRQIMMRNLGEIDYDDKAALYVGAEYPENPGCETEVLVLNTELKKYDPVSYTHLDVYKRKMLHR